MHTMDFAAANQSVESAPFTEAWAAYRLSMLNRQLSYAVDNSRFYRERLSGLSLPLASATDITRFPFTTEEDIRRHGRDMLCLGGDRIERVVTLNSTGSGGLPKRLYFTRGDLERTVDFFSAGMVYMCAPGDVVFIFMPASSDDSIGRLLAEGLHQLGANPLVFGMIQDYRQAADALSRGRPHTIVGTPSQMRKLALYAPDIRPDNVLLSADYIAQSLKETISRIWRCAVFEHYGLTESGYGCAVECPKHDGMHIRHDELLLEIVEPGGAKPAAGGEWGEIVLTTFRREAMPLIRYRTGDMGRLIHGRCACGGGLPRLAHVRGRLTELASAVNIYQMDELLLSEDGVFDYRASMTGGVLTVMVEAASPDSCRVCGERLAHQWPGLSFRVLPSDAAGLAGLDALPVTDYLLPGRSPKRGIKRKNTDS